MAKVVVKFGDDWLSSAIIIIVALVNIMVKRIYLHFFYRSIRKTILIAIFEKMKSCEVYFKKICLFKPYREK